MPLFCRISGYREKRDWVFVCWLGWAVHFLFCRITFPLKNYISIANLITHSFSLSPTDSPSKKEHIIDFQPFFIFPTEFSPFTLTSFVCCKSTRFTTYILANFFWKPTIFSDYIHYTCEIFFLLGFKFKWSLGSLLQHHYRHYQQAAKPNNLFTHILLPFYLMCCFVTDNSHSPYLILWLCSRVEKRYVKRRCPFLYTKLCRAQN